MTQYANTAASGRLTGSSSGTLSLTSSVRSFMERAGDSKVLLDCTGYVMHLAMSADNSTWANCSAFRRGRELLLVIGTNSVYLFPEERIPLADITDIVVHTHCSSVDYVCEFQIATSAEGMKETRFFSVPSENMLKEVVMTLRSVIPKARMLFHEMHWPETWWDRQVALLVSREREGEGIANPKLEAYHRRKRITEETAALTEKMRGKGGYYSKAAQQVESTLESMVEQLNSFLPPEDMTPDTGSVPPSAGMNPRRDG